MSIAIAINAGVGSRWESPELGDFVRSYVSEWMHFMAIYGMYCTGEQCIAVAVLRVTAAVITVWSIDSDNRLLRTICHSNGHTLQHLF